MSVAIYAQSNVFPRVKLYDSATPPGPLARLIKVGYEVQANGVTLYKSDQQPQVAPVIQYGAAGLVILAALWLAVRALR